MNRRRVLKWSTPIIVSVFLPAHAQGTVPTSPIVEAEEPSTADGTEQPHDPASVGPDPITNNPDEPAFILAHSEANLGQGTSTTIQSALTVYLINDRFEMEDVAFNNAVFTLRFPASRPIFPIQPGVRETLGPVSDNGYMQTITWWFVNDTLLRFEFTRTKPGGETVTWNAPVNTRGAPIVPG